MTGLARKAPSRATRSAPGRRMECPLDWLAARKDSEGRPFLDRTAVAAGERLRADYERGLRAAPVTMDYDRGPRDAAHGPRDGLSMAESAIAARARMRGAMAALGPEMARTLLAVICEGRGLEDVEAAERWPRRSAKLVVRLALDALARHYGMTAQGRGRADAWMGEDARPAL